MENNKPKIAILADLSSLAITCEGFKLLLANIERDFEVGFVKFYSYVAKRNRDYNEFIAAKGYNAVTPISSKRRNKLDSRQIIDATEIALFKGFDAVAFMVGSGDILPIISYLKLRGLDVYEINVAESEYSDSYNGFFAVPESSLRKGYLAPVMKRAAKPVRPKAASYTRPAPQEQPTVQAPRAENQFIMSAKDILAKYKKR